MAKYLLTWQVDQSRAPIDPKERGVAWGMLIDMVKNDQVKGIMKDWGAFVGETNGYSIVEGGNMVQQYIPFVSFKTQPVASISQVSEVIKSISG